MNAEEKKSWLYLIKISILWLLVPFAIIAYALFDCRNGGLCEGIFIFFYALFIYPIAWIGAVITYVVRSKTKGLLDLSPKKILLGSLSIFLIPIIAYLVLVLVPEFLI